MGLHELNIAILHVCFFLQDFVFPENVAFPIGGAGKVHTHFVLEMHYDNPNFIPGKCI